MFFPDDEGKIYPAFPSMRHVEEKE